MHLQSYYQALMAHQRKTLKHHPNGNGTSTMRLSGPTGVTSSMITFPNQGYTDQAVLQRCNSLCGPLHMSQLCTPVEKPNIGRDIKIKAIF